MQNLTLKAVATLGLFALAACGGGNSANQPPVDTPPGDTTPPVDTTPPGATGPKSTSSADLLAYVVAGGQRVANYDSDNHGLKRFQRSEVVNGKRVTVTADQFANGTYGLIQHVNGNSAKLYTVNDGLVASTTFPSGQYNGALDVDYSVNGGTSWNAGKGQINITVNTATGMAAIGGIASAPMGTGTNSVEYFGDAAIASGKFAATDMVVRYRENGAQVSDHVGSIDGMMVGSGVDAGVVGTTSANDGAFQMNGGFTGTLWLGAQ